ncbi:MAG TPA: hypothetical protein VGY58_18870 [Gemmataceae bacterium]|nr:hypothetical protein [Gemmataceae bacterium]
MKPTRNSTALPAGKDVCCDVAAFGSVQFTLDMFPALRQRPGPGVGHSLPNNFLKHADELTVASLAAVLEAVERFGMGSEGVFTNWGVVAAPAFLGRATLVNALQRYADEGAWGISPHFIPHRSQHAVAGTISQALKIHGPNFGTGGGPSGAAEGLLAGAVLLEGSGLPGVWVALAQWEPEFIPDLQGKATGPCLCRAVALALVSTDSHTRGMRLRAAPARRPETNGHGNGAGSRGKPSLETLQKALADANSASAKLVWSFNATMAIEMEINVAPVQEPAIAQPVGRLWRFGQARAGTEKKR